MRSCSAWVARDSWWRTFSQYSATIVFRCSFNRVLIFALIGAFTPLSDPSFNRSPRLIDHSFRLSDWWKLTLSTLHVSDTSRNMIAIAPYLNGLPRFIDHDCKKLGELVVVDVGVGERDCIFEDVLEVDIAGGREGELIGVCELHVLGFTTSVGCDIVQADHSPDAELHRGSSMEFSSGTMAGIRKRWKKDLDKR